MNRSRKAIIIGAAALVLLLIIGVIAFFLTDGFGLLSDDDHEHTFVFQETVRTATCTADGLDTLACECGAESLRLTKAAGHTMGQWTTETDATCYTTGTMSAVCTTCNEKVSQTIPRTKHDYAAAVEDGATDLTYVCGICADQFTVKADSGADILTERYYSDCDPNFSFKVYCEEDEAYIYEHLKIVNSYFYNTEHEQPLSYYVQSGRNHWWTVYPSEAYTEGDIYIATRSGAVFFEDFAVQDLTFAIRREESKVIELSEDVIFLQALEEKRPGYYPYTLDYSEESQTYWLSLGKKGSLSVGDTICVGNALSLDDIIDQDDEPDIFGKIKLIEYDEETRTYWLELEAPDLTELFSRLDIYSSDMIPTDGIQMATRQELTAQATQALYQSEDFATFVCAAQSTSVTYLSSRGLSTRLSTFKDFFDQIEISDEGTVEPTINENGEITGKIVLNGNIEIPVTLSSDPDSEQIGQINIYFEAFVELNSLKVTLNLETREVEIKDAEKITLMQVGANQQVTAGFTFGVEMNLEWSLGSKPYVLNTKSGTYHFKNCKHVASVKDPSQLEKITAEELFTLIAEEKVSFEKECKTCLPISSMMADNYILNTNSKTVHLYNCAHLKTTSAAVLQVSELPFGNILAAGYTECKDCSPSSRYTNSFSEQILNKMKYEDLGSNLDQFKELTEELADEEGAKQLEIAKIPFTITGIDEIELQLSVYFDFALEATMEYNYTLQINSQYGIYLTQNGFETYADSSPEPLRNDITVTGKVRVDVGVMAGINLHIKGIEKYCFVELNAKVGLYAKVQGALKHDFLYNNTGFAAAYFEAGIHCDLIGSAKLAKWETLNHSFLPDEMKDKPFLSYGYEKVYYNFTQMPDAIQIDSIYYDLENAQLLNVKYYDIVQMEDGTDTLSIMGIKGKYSVEFRLKDGTNCTVSDGYLLVDTPNEAFTDELTVVIKGYDSWGKYRYGNTKYDIESYSIPIEYDPLKNTAEIPDKAAGYNNHYYHLFQLEGVTSYEEAKAYCEAVGGYPCTVTSAEESAFVEDYLEQNGGYSQIAFGLVFDAEADAWLWDNGELMDYTDWAQQAAADPSGAALSVFGDGYSWEVGSFEHTQQGSFLILCEWGAYTDNSDMTPEERMDAVTGYYEGWYTAPQGITAGTLGIHRTNALLADEQALQLYAQWATDCSKNSEGVATQTFTAEDIANIVQSHEGEYIAIFMFGPLRVNPDVEDGLYTMSIEYDEAKNAFKLKGIKWIQRDTYAFVDFPNLTVSGNDLLGDVYGKYVEFFWTEYGDVGDVSLTRFDPLSGVQQETDLVEAA